MSHKLIVDSRLRIPKELMSAKAVERRYNIIIFDEKSCKKCENLPDRPNAMCSECPAFIADYKLWKDAGKYWSVPQGDLPALKIVLDRKEIDYVVVDKRLDIPFEYDIQWTGSLFGKGHVDANGILRANQKRVAKEWLKTKSGILRAPPRSGKTALAVYLSLKLGQKTVIFAHQYELLKQFLQTIYDMTNVKELERQHRKKIVLLVNTVAQLKKAKDYDIIILPYQKLIYDHTRIVQYINGLLGTIVVDECHNTGAVNYLRIASLLSVKHRLGLSATPKRKDNRHKLIERILGPVAAEVESTSLIPRIELFRSAAVPPRPYRIWHHAKKWLSLDKTRNLEIIKQTFKDLRDGHEVILIPVDSLAHQKLLVDAINRAGKQYNEKKDENWPKDLALAFNGSGGTRSETRKRILEQVDEPGPTVVVAIRKLIREGVNLMRPSMMYIVEPMSASGDRSIGAPMFYQMAMRICTPYKKPQPIVRIWVDQVGMFKSCLKGLFWNELWPNRYTGTEGRYYIDPKYAEMVKNIDKDQVFKQNVKNSRGWV